MSGYQLLTLLMYVGVLVLAVVLLVAVKVTTAQPWHLLLRGDQLPVPLALGLSCVCGMVLVLLSSGGGTASRASTWGSTVSAVLLAMSDYLVLGRIVQIRRHRVGNENQVKVLRESLINQGVPAEQIDEMISSVSVKKIGD